MQRCVLSSEKDPHVPSSPLRGPALIFLLCCKGEFFSRKPGRKEHLTAEAGLVRDRQVPIRASGILRPESMSESSVGGCSGDG